MCWEIQIGSVDEAYAIISLTAYRPVTLRVAAYMPQTKVDSMHERRFDPGVVGDLDLVKLACQFFEGLKEEDKAEIKKHFLFSRVKRILIVETGSMPGCVNAALVESEPQINSTIILGEPVFIDSSPESDDLVSKGRLKIAGAGAREFIREIKPGSLEAASCTFFLHNFEVGCVLEQLKQVHKALKTGGLLINTYKHRLEDDKVLEFHTNWQIKISDWKEKINLDNKAELDIFQNQSIQIMEILGFREVRKIYSTDFETSVLAKK